MTATIFLQWFISELQIEELDHEIIRERIPNIISI